MKSAVDGKGQADGDVNPQPAKRTQTKESGQWKGWWGCKKSHRSSRGGARARHKSCVTIQEQQNNYLGRVNETSCGDHNNYLLHGSLSA